MTAQTQIAAGGQQLALNSRWMAAARSLPLKVEALAPKLAPERPYRIDRMLTQLRQSGVLDRCAALVFGAMRGCDEPGGPAAIDAIRRGAAGFGGPILTGMPSGHVDGAVWTLPLGVRARVTTGEPALIIEEQAVE